MVSDQISVSTATTFLEDTDFTDAVLVCQGEEIPCHRVFMAAKSEVFKKMFLQKSFLEGNYKNIRTVPWLMTPYTTTVQAS